MVVQCLALQLDPHVLEKHNSVSSIQHTSYLLLQIFYWTGTLRGIVASVSEYQVSLLQWLEYIDTSSKPDFLINLKQCGVECP